MSSRRTAGGGARDDARTRRATRLAVAWALATTLLLVAGTSEATTTPGPAGGEESGRRGDAEYEKTGPDREPRPINGAPETGRNATFDNKTDHGFVPSLRLGLVGAPPPSPPRSTEDAHRKASQGALPFSVEAQSAQFPGGKRPNSPFNNLRPFVLGSVQAEANPRYRLPSSLVGFRPSEPDTSHVRLEEEEDKGAEDGQRPPQHPENCSGTANERHSAPHYEHQGPAAPSPPPVAAQKFFPEALHQQLQQQPLAPAAAGLPIFGYVDDGFDSEPPHQHDQHDVKPSKFHDGPNYSVRYHHAIPAIDGPYQLYPPLMLDGYHVDDNKPAKPGPYHVGHPVSYHSATYESATKPKTIVYFTSHDLSHTRKYPAAPYYHPQIYEHEVVPEPAPEDEDSFHFPLLGDHHKKSILPWKKILHVAGTLLPLGLLFALLTPKVIRATQTLNQNQNNNPNIILSKLRVNDLQAEHKHVGGGRPASTAATAFLGAEPCEERSICRLVAAAEPAGAGFLRQMMLQVAERTPESAVRKKELDRIFEAARLGNCDILMCSFYDGT